MVFGDEAQRGADSSSRKQLWSSCEHMPELGTCQASFGTHKAACELSTLDLGYEAHRG